MKGPQYKINTWRLAVREPWKVWLKYEKVDRQTYRLLHKRGEYLGTLSCVGRKSGKTWTLTLTDGHTATFTGPRNFQQALREAVPELLTSFDDLF